MNQAKEFWAGRDGGGAEIGRELIVTVLPFKLAFNSLKQMDKYASMLREAKFHAT